MPFSSKAIRERARRRVAQRVRNGEPCCFCQRPIDLAVKYPHGDSFVVDHRVPTSLGGSDHDHDDQLRPSHNRCNVLRGNTPDGTVGRNSGALD
jgi:5-methylcytosine-specific restriction endonuclease McrA